MKVQNLIFTLSLFSTLSLATPLLDVANTVVAMDKSKAALDNGEITFHITVSCSTSYNPLSSLNDD